MTLFSLLLLAVFLGAVLLLVFLLCVDAPYGKRERPGWGPAINPRLSWVLWEAPAFFSFLLTYINGQHRDAPAAILLAMVFLLHYFHRTFIYPFIIRVKPGSRSPLVLLVAAMSFNAINGWLNAYFITELGQHLWSNDWFLDWRFIIGVILFIAGFIVAKDSDHRLRNLRRPGESGYKIPYGGAFRFVSCPNYLGEIVEWSGFALMAWSPAGLAFVCFTAANLLPRALASHSWYHENFTEYPLSRKAILPGVL